MAWFGSPTAHRSSLVPSEGQDEAELRRVHILELVNREVPVPPLHALGETGVVDEEVGGAEEHVVEVEHAPTSERGLIGVEAVHDLVDRDDRRPAGGPGGGRVARPP